MSHSMLAIAGSHAVASELPQSSASEQSNQNDLRQFLETLSAHGLLRRVTQAVDWQFELGEIARTSRTPLLFENIKGYPGQRIFTNGLGSFSAIALALGFSRDVNRGAAIRKVKKRVSVPLKPALVNSGAVIENVLSGEDIDFLKFPVPQWSREESGRYLGTWHINVTRDPETRVRNVGVYRMQVLSGNRATVSTSPRSHLSKHLAKAENAGHRLEMAVAIGVAEPVIMAAGAACPYGSDEYELAGSLSGESVQLLKCKTVDLEVPANSEIVIEGFIHPNERAQDGPYFDYAGKPNTNPSAYIFEATRMMFRNNPIFRGAAIGHPGAEDLQLFGFLSELGLLDFHGSRMRHAVQRQLIKMRLFRAFQLAGRI